MNTAPNERLVTSPQENSFPPQFFLPNHPFALTSSKAGLVRSSSAKHLRVASTDTFPRLLHFQISLSQDIPAPSSAYFDSSSRGLPFDSVFLSILAGRGLRTNRVLLAEEESPRDLCS